MGTFHLQLASVLEVCRRIDCTLWLTDAWNRNVGGQEDREYLAAGQESDSRSHQRKQVQQRFHSHNGKDAIRAAPWRERRMVDVQTSHLGIGSRRGKSLHVCVLLGVWR